MNQVLVPRKEELMTLDPIGLFHVCLCYRCRQTPHYTVRA